MHSPSPPRSAVRLLQVPRPPRFVHDRKPAPLPRPAFWLLCYSRDCRDTHHHTAKSQGSIGCLAGVSVALHVQVGQVNGHVLASPVVAACVRAHVDIPPMHVRHRPIEIYCVQLVVGGGLVWPTSAPAKAPWRHVKACTAVGRLGVLRSTGGSMLAHHQAPPRTDAISASRHLLTQHRRRHRR